MIYWKKFNDASSSTNALWSLHLPSVWLKNWLHTWLKSIFVAPTYTPMLKQWIASRFLTNFVVAKLMFLLVLIFFAKGLTFRKYLLSLLLTPTKKDSCVIIARSLKQRVVQREISMVWSSCMPTRLLILCNAQSMKPIVVAHCN